MQIYTCSISVGETVLLFVVGTGIVESLWQHIVKEFLKVHIDSSEGHSLGFPFEKTTSLLLAL